MYNKSTIARQWAAMRIRPDRLLAVQATVKRLAAHRDRYAAVEKLTGVPWAFIACLHERESGADFSTYLGNGEPLIRVTRLVPAGRGPFATWEDGAVDALRLQGFHKITDWSVEHILYLAEVYNGLGYAKRGLPSPYVWGATNQQKPGKYVRDGVFDSTVMDTQIGVAPMFQLLTALVGVVLPAAGDLLNPPEQQRPGAGVTVPHTVTGTNMLGIVLSTLVGALGASGLGADAIHNVAAAAGALGVLLSMVNQFHIVSATNANTISTIAGLLTQVGQLNAPKQDTGERV
jgi:lysozyme family protein